jgi:hypothetical protein
MIQSSEIRFDTKHARWIIDAALEKFTEELNQYETDLTRHELMLSKGSDTYFYRPTVQKARNFQIERLEFMIAEHRMVCERLCHMRDAVTDRSAEEFSEEMSEFLDQLKKP